MKTIEIEVGEPDYSPPTDGDRAAAQVLGISPEDMSYIMGVWEKATAQTIWAKLEVKS